MSQQTFLGGAMTLVGKAHWIAGEIDYAQLARTTWMMSTMLPGSWDKRFSRDMAALAAAREPHFTEKQKKMILYLAYKYRRQTGFAPE